MTADNQQLGAPVQAGQDFNKCKSVDIWHAEIQDNVISINEQFFVGMQRAFEVVNCELWTRHHFDLMSEDRVIVNNNQFGFATRLDVSCACVWVLRRHSKFH